MLMKYTLYASSHLDFETHPGGITIIEKGYPGEETEVFISTDRIEEVIKIFQHALTVIKEGED